MSDHPGGKKSDPWKGSGRRRGTALDLLRGAGRGRSYPDAALSALEGEQRTLLAESVATSRGRGGGGAREGATGPRREEKGGWAALLWEVAPGAGAG